jgi:ATP-dependent Lhr-like helicase
VLLTQPLWLAHFTALRWIVVDEVHAFAPGRRGADLTLSLERLEDIAAVPPQRIGLSATCAPLRVAAAWLAGDRSCEMVSVPERTPARLDIEPLPEDGGFVARLVDRLTPELEQHTTILVFTNARGLAERLTWALRQRFPALAPEIAAHHSSLAPARRRDIERRLKQGRLRVVVSSTSLELGIDIGGVDLVVLVHPPGGVVRLVQRLGRSGHRPGGVRRGLVLTAGAAELLEAAVTCASSHDAQLEPLWIPEYPLDVLCQHLLGMAAARPWEAEEAFALARRAYPYRNLERRDFDDCLDYLMGRHRDGREWLPARLQWAGGSFVLAEPKRTLRILRQNVGTIFGDQPWAVRSSEGRLIGHVEEAFADRLQAGDRFLLDGRCLEYRRAAWLGVEVDEVPGRPAVPRWTSDAWPLALDLTRRVYLLRVRASEALRDGPAALMNLLRTDYLLNEEAAGQLAALFQEQEQVSEIPDAQTVLVEAVPAVEGAEYYLHTPLHRAGNEALAHIVELRLTRRCTVMAVNLGLLLYVEGSLLSADALRRLLAADGFDADLERALADGGLLRERFRRAALTGLMLLRNPLGQRRKVGGADWAERRLFDQVRDADPDFVLLRQARRDVRQECCDAAAGRVFVESLPRLAVRLRLLAEPSPLGRGLHGTR